MKLFAALPVPDPAHQRTPEPRLSGDIPSPVHPLGRGPLADTLRDRGEGHLVAQE